MDTDRKIRIGITGQAGFIGTHIYNFLGTKTDEVERVAFRDDFFEDYHLLCEFVSQCDVIIHLAALNRHNDPQTIYNTNIQLVDQLIAAMEDTDSKPHVLFSSSIQEERNNIFGQSKKEGRTRFANWALKNEALFTGMLIPNVYGPFGNPYYNSVVATFCHQITHGEQAVIDTDAKLNLIYIQELVDFIWKVIQNEMVANYMKVPHTTSRKVSEIYQLLQNYAEQYIQEGIIPQVDDNFEYNLFNTFICYNDLQSFYPFEYDKHEDDRGSFVEIIKTLRGGQVSFSTTKPEITRGNHYHTRKLERFAVIKGKALVCLRRIGTSEVIEFVLDGDKPSFIDIPVWYTHNITNIGNEELYTVFWINEFFNPEDPDTYFEEVNTRKEVDASHV